MIIYEGTSRFDKVFKAREITWGNFAESLKTPVVTSETVAEYKAFSKARQNSIKDVGAFVGGTLEGGYRTKVESRCIVTLDADYADGLFEDSLAAALSGSAYIYYSTHKHTTKTPRYRVLIPLLQSVNKDEYGAISRKLAELIYMDYFDDTTYQPQRIMYYPSVSRNGSYVCEVSGGSMLDPDKILAMYDDWTDVRCWPVSSRQKQTLRKSNDTAENPRKKEGIIGAFCRVYSIEAAIEKFVPDYVPGSIEGRYTYAKGSTTNGVVTYDGIFSYSHHDTDPASLRLCNAFDLVRLHKFGHLDKKADYASLVNTPSYNAMLDTAGRLPDVKKELAEAFTQDFESGPIESDNWTNELKLSKQGKVLSNYHNIELILKNHKKFKGKLRYNEFTDCYELAGQTITDYEDSDIRAFLDKGFGVTGKDKIYDCVNIVARLDSYHPVKQYLESLTWDGTPRIDDVFIDYFGAEEADYIEYTKAVSRKFFVAAVKRIYEPGCHFDEMLTLRGPQGCGKSSFFRRLSKGFFTDSLKDIKSKDAMEALKGVWICEFGELAALKKADSEAIKGFVSSPVDRFRKAYGRRTEDHKRQCVFVGTTNELEFLRDMTGNRRYWVVSAVKGVEPNKDIFKITEAEIDQLWAEAKYLYNTGLEDTILRGRIKDLAELIQEQYRTEDPREAEIKEFLELGLPENFYDLSIDERIDLIQSGNASGPLKRDRVCVREIWQECFGNRDVRRLNRFETMEINSILECTQSWRRVNNVRIAGYERQRGFVHDKRYKPLKSMTKSTK